jgi:cytoskeletal protein CcmA (bactofilin family)
MRVKGSITGVDSVVVIAGTVDGPIEVDGLLHILAGGHVAGPVTATDVVVEGELKARLVARGRVELRATAHVHADIQARTLAIAEGCVFDGRMHMGGEGAAAPTRFHEKRGRKGGRHADTSPPRSST